MFFPWSEDWLVNSRYVLESTIWHEDHTWCKSLIFGRRNICISAPSWSAAHENLFCYLDCLVKSIGMRKLFDWDINCVRLKYKIKRPRYMFFTIRPQGKVELRKSLRLSLSLKLLSDSHGTGIIKNIFQFSIIFCSHVQIYIFLVLLNERNKNKYFL